jgi:hypothetical protein
LTVRVAAIATEASVPRQPTTRAMTISFRMCSRS